MIEYTLNTAKEFEILKHLERCDKDFIPLLSERVDIIDYSWKIYHKAITFSAWNENNDLIGLVAMYETDNNGGFITSVSVVNDYKKQGVGFILMKRCIAFAINNKYKKLYLEVDHKNTPALELYKKFGFIIINTKNNTYECTKEL